MTKYSTVLIICIKKISFSFYTESHQFDLLMSPDFSCAEITSNNSA